jgi:hypothetical protein
MAFKNLRRSIRGFREEKKVSGHSWPTHCLLTTIVWVFTSQYGHEQRSDMYSVHVKRPLLNFLLLRPSCVLHALFCVAFRGPKDERP